MTDTRRKNVNWNLGEKVTWESLHAAVLMDIRDELQTLNSLLHCHRFVGLPGTLERIDRRLARGLPLKKGRAR